MRAALRTGGLVLFLGLAAFLAWFGFVYATVDKMLWFHAAAEPEAVRPAIAPLYFALMRLIGAASLGLAVLGVVFTLGPVRRGSRTAALWLAVSYAVPLAGAAWVAERLAAETGAPVSWHIMGVLLAVDALALLASVVAKPE